MDHLDVRRLEHIYREGNAPADLLAKGSCSLDLSFKTFESPPANIINVVLVDQIGIIFFKICNINQYNDSLMER